MNTGTSISEIKRAVHTVHQEPTDYTEQCAALHIKPNSRVVDKNETLLTKEKLDFSSNYLGGAGFQALTDTICKNDKLDSLNVSGNGLSNSSVVFFCRAIADHPTLRVMDLSDNPALSLPSGLALIDLVHKNPRLAEIHLANTNIEDAVQRRLRRGLNLNKVPHKAPATNSQGLTPFQKAKAEHDRRTAPRKELAEKAKLEREARASDDIAQWLSTHKEIVAPPRRHSGWAVVNLCIDSSATDFKSELELIHNRIIPQLNQRFASRKVHFVPMAMHTDIPSDYHEKISANRRAAVRADYRHWAQRGSPFYLHLIGDRVGLLEQENRDGQAVKPIQQRAYEYSSEAAHGCALVMMRQTVQKMGIPVGLLPLMSDQPLVVHPDANAAVVKVAVAEAQGIKHKLTDFDLDLLKKRWNDHLEFKRTINRDHHPSFVVPEYTASFDSIDQWGFVRLGGLDHFASALTRRLVALVNHFYPPQPKNRYLPADPVAVERNWLSQSVDMPTGKRHLIGKLELYTVTPPSRNMALVYGGTGTGSTTIMRAYVKRNQPKQMYHLAAHFTQQATVYDEPSDPRTLFVSLIRQLSPDQTVPSFVTNEVDVMRVKEHFQQTLRTVAGHLAENHVLVLVIDGIENLDPSVVPCESLRLSETGVDAWNPPPTVSTIQPRPPRTVVSRDAYDWIPVCLSRNMRVIATTTTNSPAHNLLGQRGHDSCDPVFTGELGENDVESIVLAESAKIGLDLDDAQIESIRGKVDSRNPEYLRHLFTVLKHFSYTPQYLSIGAFLNQLPHTVDDLCLSLLRDLERAVGVPLAKLCVSLLLLSRWGLLEVELRELLAKHAPALSAKRYPTRNAEDTQQQQRRLLNTELTETILRILSPVLQSPVTPSTTPAATGEAATTTALNALDCLVYIESSTFRKVATLRYLTAEGDVITEGNAETIAHAEVDTTITEQLHHHLAHYYRRLAVADDHPQQPRALKEMPYHMVQAGMWTTFEQSVVSLEYVSAAYRFGLGYPALREMIRAYNKMDLVSNPTNALEALKLKLKEYVYFVRDHNVNLVQYPHMVRQIAITCGTDTHLNKDAQKYFESQSNQPHFAVVNKTKGKLHREKITACCFAPSGLRFATCSDDRSVKICGLKGKPLVSINKSVSRLTAIAYSRTSRYICAVAEDHSVLSFDASVLQAEDALIAPKFTGHTARINSIAMSGRGRFIVTGSEDRTMRVWESETGVLIATVSHVSFAHHTSAYGGVTKVLTHPIEEDKFFSVCDRKFFGWRLAHSRDSCDQLHCITAHSTLPIASVHVIHDGQFAITTCKDLAAPAPGSYRTEENIKVWSIGTGRQIAMLSMGVAPNSLQYGPVFSEVSPTERILASALGDGSLQLHQLDVRSFAPSGDEPMVITPYRHFTAYLDHPTPVLTIVRFSFDDRHVCATGNLRQLKVWNALPDSMTPTPVGRGTATPGSPSPTMDSKSSDKHAVADQDDDQDAANDPLLAPVAEFLMDQPTTCIDWTPNPTGKGAELVVGDTVGRMRALRLKTQKELVAASLDSDGEDDD